MLILATIGVFCHQNFTFADKNDKKVWSVLKINPGKKKLHYLVADVTRFSDFLCLRFEKVPED